MDHLLENAQPDHEQIVRASLNPEPAAPKRFVVGVFAAIAVWLAAAACVVQIEYYDGMSAIANARYFLGHTERYVADRAPLMGLLLTPAELVRNALGLHPLEVRPYHILLALFHTAYLVLSYRLLKRVCGPRCAFAAWAAAVPNFIFISYSPFLSHDIIPGVILLLMLIWSDDFTEHPSYILWTGLVALGAVAALVKQTFGIFWVLLLLASAFQCFISKGGVSRATLLKLACGAVCSGVITWTVLGWVLRNSDPHSPLLTRPLHNLQYLSRVYDGKDVVFPLWIYLRNGPAYGWLALLLVVPGWVLSMRGTRLQQSVAVAWLGGLVFMHLLPLREVRYIAFLAPLTACLLVPALCFVAKQRIALAAAMLALCFDAGRCALEAAQVFHPFYTTGIEREFFELLDDAEYRSRPVLVNAPMYSFISPIPSPLAADRYHRVFHFGIIHLREFYDCQDLRVLADAQGALQIASACPDGSLLLYANEVLARGPSWTGSHPIADAGFTQCVAVCRSQEVRMTDASANEGADSDTVTLVRTSAGADGKAVIQGEPCIESAQGELFPLLRIETPRMSYWLVRMGSDSYAVSGAWLSDPIGEAQSTQIRRFEINRRVLINAAE